MRQENRLLQFSVIFQNCFSFSSWHRKILRVLKWNTVQNTLKSGGSCKHLETWITVKKLSLWEFKSSIRKSPTPAYLVSFLTSREGTVCLQIHQTKLISFQTDHLLIANVLHYCPERRKTLFLGTVSTRIRNNSTRHAYFHPSYLENVRLSLDLQQRRQ